MIKILRKKGWILNPNDKVVNSILRAIEKNKGYCPCSHNTSVDKCCPCSSYREEDNCCCGLYKHIDDLQVVVKHTPLDKVYIGDTATLEGD